MNAQKQEAMHVLLGPHWWEGTEYTSTLHYFRNQKLYMDT